ncbi:MAG: hypothetical protein GQF41_4184 [Candidatus Rifleibacterium amylolyticum]|nr:MAG: hypothetical protein GQF41_4184 [Candidatus Rifleibacterium amylolyticum]
MGCLSIGAVAVLLGLVIVFVLSRIAGRLFDLITLPVSGVGIKFNS